MASPRVGRTNFPLDPGYLPASIVVKLAPFNAETLQHFVFLERPQARAKRDGAGFACERAYVRGTDRPHLTPDGERLRHGRRFLRRVSARACARSLRATARRDAFGGDPALQLSPAEVNLPGARPVVCLKTALAAFAAIVEQGEGAPRDSAGSHYQKFHRHAHRAAGAAWRRTRSFAPAFPAATNPVLRRPPRPEGRVWIEDADAFATVDLANACYGLMLRLLAYAYVLRGPGAEKTLAVDLAIGLMQALMPLAERAARLPAGPVEPALQCGHVVHRAARCRARCRRARGAAPVRRALRTSCAEAAQRVCARGGDARALAGRRGCAACAPARAARLRGLRAAGAVRCAAGRRRRSPHGGRLRQ